MGGHRPTTITTRRPARPRCGPARCTARAGFTLIELLIVLGLIAVLLGLGAGLLTRRSSDLELSTRTLRDLVRTARASARFYQSPARLVLEPPLRTTAPTQGASDELVRRTLRVLSVRPVSEWNFDLTGANGTGGILGTMGAAHIEEGGRFGHALVPDPAGGQPGVFVRASEYSAFDLRLGFVVRCDLWLESRDASTILRLGPSFELAMNQQGFAEARVTFAQAGQAGRTTRLRGLRPLPLRQWFRLQLGYDGKSLTLLRDGIEEDERPGDGLVWIAPEAEFWISAGDTPVPGRIDSVELFAYETVAEFELPEFIEFTQAPAALHFAPSGSLDPRHHDSPPLYALTLLGTELAAEVRVELGGLPQ